MTCKTHDELENNLPKNKKDLALRKKEDHSSESLSDDNIELLISKFIKHKNKDKNELKKKKLLKKR